MKISEILTQEEMTKLEKMTDYAVPVWAVNNMLRSHWKELTVDQWIELEKLFEISGISTQIKELTDELHKDMKRIRNSIEETYNG